jgi:hypothetical protein
VLHCALQVEFVVHALELFRQVDVNDDGGMEWEELVGYIVEAGLSTSGSSSRNDNVVVQAAACCVLRAACCVLRATCCVLRAACCVLRAAWLARLC